MKMFSAYLNSSWLRRVASASLVIASLLCGAATLLAGQEPGPEADGVYRCGKLVKDKFVEIGFLEIKGKTYKSYAKKEAKASFEPFTTDGKGKINWSNSLSFLDYTGNVSSSVYSVNKDGQPSVAINYSENHTPAFMTCTKEK